MNVADLIWATADLIQLQLLWYCNVFTSCFFALPDGPVDVAPNSLLGDDHGFSYIGRGNISTRLVRSNSKKTFIHLNFQPFVRVPSYYCQ